MLLGHRLTRAEIEIDDYLLVSSEEQKGSRYGLDTSALERVREECSAGDENSRRSQVVGYFRTQTEGDLHLRNEEINLVEEHFRDPTDVLLVIQTSDEPYTSGFFFWMTKHEFAPFSLMDFPFDAELLQAKVAGSPASQPEEEGDTAPSAAAADRLTDETRPRRPQSMDTAPPEAVSAYSREPAHVSLRMVGAVAAVFALPAIASLTAFLLRDRGSTEPRQKEPTTVAASPLQLDVEVRGGGLDVRWNPQSAPVNKAREGSLAIFEGDQQPPQIIHLDLQQLKGGHIYFRSSADRVKFQLELVDNSGRISTESVTALSSSPPSALSPVAPPVRPLSPGPVMDVFLDATEPSWVSMRDRDGKILFAQLLVPGFGRTVKLLGGGILRTGNAGGLVVRLNGNRIGPIGPLGKVCDIEFKDGRFTINSL